MAVNPIAFLNPFEITKKIDDRVREDEMYDIRLEESARKADIDDVRLKSAELRLEDAASAFGTNELKRQKENEELSLLLARNDARKQTDLVLQQNPGFTRAQVLDSLLLQEKDPAKISAYRSLRDGEIVSSARSMIETGNTQAALSLLFENQMLPGVSRVPTADGAFAFVTSEGTPVDPASVYAAMSSGKLSAYMNAQRQAENSRTVARIQEEGRNARTLATVAARLGSKQPETKQEAVNLLTRAVEVRAAAYKDLDAALKAAEPPSSGARSPDIQRVLDARVEEARISAVTANQDVSLLRQRLAQEPQINEPVSRQRAAPIAPPGSSPVTTSLVFPAEKRSGSSAPLPARPSDLDSSTTTTPGESFPGASSFGLFP